MSQTDVLNFRVEKKRITVGDGIPVHDKVALVRKDNNAVLSIVGSDFGLIQNDEVFSRVDKEITNIVGGIDRKNAVITDGIAYKGAICYRDYHFPTVKPKRMADMPNTGDSVTDLGLLIRVKNGFRDTALSLTVGVVDFYCTNGMVSWKQSLSYRQSHLRGANPYGITTFVLTGINWYQKESKTWMKWMRKNITPREVEIFLGKAFPKSNTLRTNLLHQFEQERQVRDSTVWALVSSLSYYSSHIGGGRFAVRERYRDNASHIRATRQAEVARIMQSRNFLQLAA